MAANIRRTISELATLYELEPDIRDVVVEGIDDRVLIKWYLNHRCDVPVSIIGVDSIEVPSELLTKYDLNEGNRGRALAVAFELNEILDGASAKCCTVIYDSDLDAIKNTSINIGNVLNTDFASLEMYLFDVGAIAKFTNVVLMIQDFDHVSAMDHLRKVLVRLWLIKAANHLLDFRMTWISFDKVCKFNALEITFDENEFINRYLMRNSKLDEAEKFKAKIAEIESKLTADARHHMDGHHFLVLCRLYFRKFVKENGVLNDERGFERAFFGCLELGYLDQFPLFQHLLRRIALN